ncbi:MAG: NUDIX domain-containing protein [Clostridiaceae bacterium]|nr:NUDIX domain-containing protein [Clostridiaceae bacterium]
MIKVEFEDIKSVKENLFKYAVIVSCYQGKWIYCKHRQRDTWETPGGHREKNETIFCTAKRELYEETGALDFALYPVAPYSVTSSEKSYGFLFYADIKKLGPLPESEIECIDFFENPPENLTYPYIHPLLLDKAKEYIMRELPFAKDIS